MVTFEDRLEEALSKLLRGDYSHLKVTGLYVVDHEYHDKNRPGFISFTLREFGDSTYIDWIFLVRAMDVLSGTNVTVGCYTGDDEAGSLRVTVEGIDAEILHEEYGKLTKRGKKSCSTKAPRRRQSK